MLEASRISVRVGGRLLLSEVSLSFGAGGVTAVVGPNGAGKSTLLAALSGERRPDAGEVRLDGRPLADWSVADLARRRAVMHQSAPLEFPFSVDEVVALGLAAAQGRGRVRPSLDPCLAAADVLHLRRRLYPSLSGGERQRVQFARALAQSRAAGERGGVLLLDEPTASLDPRHQHRLLGAARTWAAETGGAVVAVLHDLSLAAAYADVAAVLCDGELAWLGAPRDMPTAMLARVFGVPFLRLDRPDGGGCVFVPAVRGEGVALPGSNDNDTQSQKMRIHIS